MFLSSANGAAVETGASAVIIIGSEVPTLTEEVLLLCRQDTGVLQFVDQIVNDPHVQNFSSISGYIALFPDIYQEILAYGQFAVNLFI